MWHINVYQTQRVRTKVLNAYHQLSTLLSTATFNGQSPAPQSGTVLSTVTSADTFMFKIMLLKVL